MRADREDLEYRAKVVTSGFVAFVMATMHCERDEALGVVAEICAKIEEDFMPRVPIN